MIIPAANRIDLVDLPDQGRPALGWDALLFLWKFFGAEGIIEGEAKMTDQQLLARIVPDPKFMVGKVDFLCYSPEEFKRMKNRATIVREAVLHGIEI